MSAPLIIGAGPAGCAAAIALGEAGAEPVLVDRSEEVGDALCGGFMSWRTAQTLGPLGIDLASLGAQRVTRLVLFAGSARSQATLPAPAFGLSRLAFDTALRERAIAAGARLEIDHIRALEAGVAWGEARERHSDSIFLASGKHDVRAAGRPRGEGDTTLGLRFRIPHDAKLTKLVGDAIELHLFAGGYAGIVLQEDGSANICLAVRKRLLSAAGGSPRDLLEMLANANPQLGERWRFSASDLPIDSIAAVPYGWIARDTEPGLFRLGDQAAVIPSLAGEGMGIALASGGAAARAWLAGGAGAARAYQQAFAREAWRPVRTAQAIWRMGESGPGARVLTALAGGVPPAAGWAMQLSRIAA